MTRYVRMRDRIYDLQDGSLITDRPTDRRGCHSIWSAEALLDALNDINAPTFIKPFYFLDVFD